MSKYHEDDKTREIIDGFLRENAKLESNLGSEHYKLKEGDETSKNELIAARKRQSELFHKIKMLDEEFYKAITGDEEFYKVLADELRKSGAKINL